MCNYTNRKRILETVVRISGILSIHSLKKVVFLAILKKMRSEIRKKGWIVYRLKISYPYYE